MWNMIVLVLDPCFSFYLISFQIYTFFNETMKSRKYSSKNGRLIRVFALGKYIGYTPTHHLPPF